MSKSQRRNGIYHWSILEDILTEYDDLKNRLTLLENKVNEIRSTNKPGQPSGTEPPDTLLDHLAEHVDVVGLVEAIESPRRLVRYIWGLLFLLGVGSTVYYIYANAVEYLNDPTATMVKFIPQAEYEYPPLIVCPRTWINADKVLSMGLTRDAFKYSLAYATVEAVDSTTDIDAGREQFLKFYQSRNYSSLFDYLKDISIDLEAFNSPSRSTLKAGDSSLYACYRCKNKTAPLEKVFIDNRICYVIQFQPEREKRFRNWNSAPEVTIRVQDLSQGVAKQISAWRAYLMPDRYLRQPHYAYITLIPNQVSTIKLSVMRFITFSSENFPCIHNNKETVASTRFHCIAKCLYEIYMTQYKCRLFPYEPYNKAHQLSEYCNYFEKVGEQNFTHHEVWGKNMVSPLDSKEAERCVEKCPHKCDRRIFTSMLDSQFPVAGSSNATATVGVRIDYIPVTQGGVMTLTEISTLSWVGFVSNIGGTLGLFIGGTVLTVFQVLMVTINYFLDARKKTKVNCEKPDKTSITRRHLAIPAITPFSQTGRTILESTSSDV